MSEEAGMVDAAERYELEGEPYPHDLPIRPDLFGLFGAGIAVLVEQAPGDSGVREFTAWLHIGENGQATVCSGKAEVGQNIRTSLAQAAADELAVGLSQVRVVLGDTDLTPFDRGTFGSRTTPFAAPQVRRAAAAARELLIELAAQHWQVDRATLAAGDGHVAQESTGRSLSYGELARGQRSVRIAGQDVGVKTADCWSVAGTPAPKADGRDFVTGRHRFSIDFAVEGMLYGKALHPPVWNALLRSADTRRARAAAGVRVVEEDGFIAVAAPGRIAAMRAVAAIEAEWETPDAPVGNDLISLLRPEPTRFVDAPDAGIGHRLEATYTVAYIAHIPLEPRAALAWWKDGRLTVWTGTQRPFGVREELAAALGLSIDHVRVIVPDTGSGYGGKHTGDAAVEAARLARAAGAPVKVAWSREEEFLYAYLRPAGVIDVSAGLSADGRLMSWEFHNYNSGGAAIQSPYAVPSQQVQFHEVQSPLRQGSYRALAATANNFARESHMDDLAHLAGIDPLAFRMKNLDDPRLQNVLLAAAERFGWQNRRHEPGRGFGIAGGTEKGSYIANCVELKVEDDGTVKLLRIAAAFECGAIVNPLHLENQVEGATVMGIGGALFEAIRFDANRILNARLSEYRIPRFSDVPPIDVVLLDRKDIPSAGAGETPIIAIAPAIANALFEAIGLRIRSLPLAPAGIPASQAIAKSAI